ncbi:flavin-containing monooxygenase [Sphingomonas sp. SRS2]|uniref:flavin-containing monooxygenase n=1 Tax=Sphingomonas sp. SRS2 TaxID=133190 RepID=UPI000618452F|nr:NAD(P)/FAD-dependent oxidoreductase [Sphingomonas sp. SRS2]KKC26082.1 cyclohexanone monooxygenase [Sphingomonas sp. SRS2]
MPTPTSGPDGHSERAVDYDVVIIGAGFGGLRAFHEMTQLGLSVRIVEAGSDVGGTWHWNRYPGVRTDSESWTYCYSFSDILMQEWSWPEKMASGEQVQAYLAFVADRLDIRRHIDFGHRVDAVRYDGDANIWTVTGQTGLSYRSRFVITAVGLLTKVYDPPFPGLEKFKGDYYLSARWPDERIDFTGKRVAVIGTGSTGIQILPIVALEAEQVTLFQRTANYVLPARNNPISAEEQRAIKKNYERIWSEVRNQVFAFAMPSPGRLHDDVTDAERHAILEAGWETGGFHYLFDTFDDVMVDERSNEAASEFVRQKIRAIVKDPATAEKLSPNYPIGAKRTALGHGYYETFNRENVSLVDISEDPIVEITSDGVRTAGAAYDFDILIFALGFDAATGALNDIEVRGRDGILLRDKWQAGPRTALGVAVDGFPNLFMVSGPQAPFANIPPITEAAATWIGRAVKTALQSTELYIEASPEEVQAWTDHITTLLDATLLAKVGGLTSWFLGSNIPGKPRSPLFHFGGANRYFDELRESAESGFPGFTIARSGSRVSSDRR